MKDVLSFDAFSPLVGNTVKIVLETGTPVGLSLESVTNLLGGVAATGGRGPFSLTLMGPLAPLLPQRTYAFEFGPLGKLDIFIVPIGRTENGIRYEAIFN